MDSQVPPRKGGAKYGKTARPKVMSWNFWELDNPTTIATATKRLPISPQSPGNKPTAKEPIEAPESPTHSASPSFRPASPPRSPEPLSNDLEQSAATNQISDQSMFDVLSSEDERSAINQRPIKRRKLVKAPKQQNQQQFEGQEQQKTKKPRQALAQKEENVPEVQPAKHKEQAFDPLTTTDIETNPSNPSQVQAPTMPSTSKATKVKYSRKNKTNFTDSTKTVEETAIATNVVERAEPGVAPTRIVSKTKLKRPISLKEQRLQAQPMSQIIQDEFAMDEDENAQSVVPVKNVASSSKLKQPTVSRKKHPNTKQRPQFQEHDDYAMDEDIPLQRLGPPKKIVSKTKPTRPTTPKKQHYPVNDSDDSIGTPGSLGITELRLTPGGSPSPQSPPRSDPSEAVATPARRGRTRLIDMLDAQIEDSSQLNTRAASIEHSALLVKPDASEEIKATKLPSQPVMPALARTESSQTRQKYGRVKNTYAKERSYLRDMVDDLDVLSQASSQEASQQLASQLASSGPSQLSKEFELIDTSSDDAGSALKVKSIHELRQAGARNQIETDFDTLLADIDPTSKSVSISRRIQALMKLIKKISKGDAAAHVSDHTVDQLGTWSRLLRDRTSKLLLNMIFWRLVNCNNTSTSRIKTIVTAIVSGTSLITNLGTMSQLVEDVKERLPSTLVRELVTFEQTILADKLLPAYEGDSIVPAAVVLAALNDSLRKLAEAGATNVSIGKKPCKNIVTLLEQTSQINDDGMLQNKFITKVALSLLQTFSGPLDNDLCLEGSEYVALGNTLARITTSSTDKHSELVQPVLHFIISLCNDRPEICDHITKSDFSSAAMNIINSRFLNLVHAAETADSVDPSELDSIILSLACLLNMTEYDDHARVQVGLGGGKLHDSYPLESLVNIYTEAAPKLVGATTTEQVQMLVGFGYLSLLICNLCLNEKVWRETNRVLQVASYTMSDVVASAKELLIHLRTVEAGDVEDSMMEVSMIQDGHGAIDGFTQRFGQILVAVKIA